MQHWVAISGRKSLFDRSSNEDRWWCFPATANPGDKVFLYCPRSMSGSRHGLFAEAKIVSAPSTKRKENCYCGAYGNNSGLMYCEISTDTYFNVPLTAKAMKTDPTLRNSNLVRRNFQGTIFAIDIGVYDRIHLLLQQAATSSSTHTA